MNGPVSVFHIQTKMSSKFYDFQLVKTGGGIWQQIWSANILYHVRKNFVFYEPVCFSTMSVLSKGKYIY